MHITLISTMPRELAQHFSAGLQAQGYDLQFEPAACASPYALRYGNGTDWQALQQLQQAIQPFTPPWQQDATLEANTVVLQLSGQWPEDALLQVFSDAEPTLRQLHHQLEHQGFTVHEAKRAFYEQGVIAYSPALQWAAQQLAYWAQQQNVALQLMQVEGNEQQALMLYYPEPQLQNLCAKQRFMVEITTDAVAQAETLAQQLQQAGFTQVVILPATKPLAKFKVNLGPLRSQQFLPAKASLLQALSQSLQQHGVDTHSYKLHIAQQRTLNQATAAHIRISYPLAATLSGQLLPYSGDTPKRLSLTIKTDAPDLAAGLVQQLTEVGFNPPCIEQQEMPNQGFLLEANTDELPMSINLLKQQMEAAIAAEWQLQAGEFRVQLKQDTNLSAILKGSAGKTLHATLHLPALGNNRAERLRALARGAGCRLVICSPTSEAWQTHLFSQHEYAFYKVEFRHNEDNSPRIQYGGASQKLIDALQLHCQTAFALNLSLDKSWSDTDSDIYLHLPAYEAPQTPPLLPSLKQLACLTTQATQPFIIQNDDTVSVGGQVLLVNDKYSLHTPQLEDYANFCVDQTTAKTLYFIAQSVALEEPCLLQGPTAASKTSAVLYMAAMLKRPVVRVNLSLQTEVADLIGRWVPAPAARVAPDEATLRQHQALLSPASHQLLEQAGTAPLGVFSRQLIAAREGLVLPGFSWQDGPVIKALKQGAWLLLDEVNLASSAVLERLNALLEPNPAITLYEYDNSVLQAKNGFMLFATMNPGHYAGRQALSDAWVDRFSCLQITEPTEEDITAMITQWYTGITPGVVCGQWQYAAGQQTAVLGALQCAEADATLWQCLAQFHLACQQYPADLLLGSRRQLWRVMQFINSQVQAAVPVADALQEAITRYYLDRVNDDTKQSLQQLSQALQLLQSKEFC